jgi:LysR family transcriptional regulator, regulator for metE and metH
MRKLELQHLRLIKHIVDEGSMSGATQKMFLTQSALSHMLKEMESDLGVKLFLRKSRKLNLTEAGSAILYHSERILAEYSELEKKIADLKTEKKERIRVTSGCFTSYHWLPSIVRRFREENIAVTIEILTEAVRNPHAYLETGKLDIAIADSKPLFPSAYQTELLFEDEFVLLVSKNNRLAALEQIDFNDLNGVDLLIHDMEEEKSTAINHFIKPNKVLLNSVIKMQLTEGIIEMVAADLGVTIMPTWIASPYVQDAKVTAVRFPKNSFKRKWYVVSHKNKSPAQRMFIEYLQQELQEYAGRPMLVEDLQ